MEQTESLDEEEITEKTQILKQMNDIDQKPENNNIVKVSVVKRIILIIGAWIVCILIASVPTSGYQNLRAILVNEGVYRWLCDNSTLFNSTDVHELCEAQIYRFGLMFSLASAFINVTFFIAGPFNDIIGPKICGLVGCFISLVGIIVFSFSSEYFDGYIPGYVLLTIGGSFIGATSGHLSNLLPERLSYFHNMAKNSISVIVFFCFQLITEQTSLMLKHLLWIYTLLPICGGLYFLFFQPWKTYQKGLKKVEVGKGKFFSRAKKYFKKYLENCWTALKTFKFWCVTVYACVLSVSVYFYLQTFSDQLMYYGKIEIKNENDLEKRVDVAVYVFGIILFVVGFISSLFLAFILSIFGKYKNLEEKKRLRITKYCQFISFACGFFYVIIFVLVQTVCSVIPNQNLQYVTMVSFVAQRSGALSLWYIFDVIFFPNIISTASSLQGVIAGVISFSNYGWVVASNDNFTPFNISFGIIYVAVNVFMAFASIIWLYKRENLNKKMSLPQESNKDKEFEKELENKDLSLKKEDKIKQENHKE